MRLPRLFRRTDRDHQDEPMCAARCGSRATVQMDNGKRYCRRCAEEIEAVAWAHPVDGAAVRDSKEPSTASRPTVTRER
jgi:hypothetical protein